MPPDVAASDEMCRVWQEVESGIADPYSRVNLLARVERLAHDLAFVKGELRIEARRNQERLPL